jgi:hypothetical protein
MLKYYFSIITLRLYGFKFAFSRTADVSVFVSAKLSLS